MPAAAKKAAAPPVKLTRDRVEKLKPAERPYEVRDAMVAGLRVLVLPSGHRSWLFRYTLGGTYKKLTVGHFPAVPLEEARKAAAGHRGEVVQGRDPAADKAAARAPANTVLAAFKAYDRNHLSWGRDYVDHETGAETPAVRDKDGKVPPPAVTPATAAATRSFFVRRVLPVWGNRQVGSITRQDVVALLDSLRAFKDAARKAKTRLSHFFRWTMDRHDSVKINPAAGVATTGSDARERILTDDELRRVWAACEQVGTFGAMVRVLILTMARRNEVAEMERSELTGSYFSIGEHRTKNGRAMDIHRTALFNSIIAALPESKTFVFEGRHHDRPIGGFSDWKSHLDSAIGDDMPRWTLHDLRRTSTSLMQRLGISPEVRRACANQAVSVGIGRTYDRHAYAAEKVRAFEALAAEVARIVNH